MHGDGPPELRGQAQVMLREGHLVGEADTQLAGEREMDGGSERQ